MKEKAVEKINAEMQKEKNAYVEVIGDFLLKQLEVIPGAAEKILDKDKSIMKSLNEMRKAAEKKKVGNYAVLTDQEGFEIVLKYFGIEAVGINAPIAISIKHEPKENVQAKKEAPSSKEIDIDFDIKLEDFI